MMAMEAMPTPAAVKPLAKREADFSNIDDDLDPINLQADWGRRVAVVSSPSQGGFPT
jgi:hypothetical protein